MLRALNLQKSYGAHMVLRGVTLTISASDRIGLVGANGAGKSTLLRLLAGESPDAGTVHADLHVRIGFLPQELPECRGTVWEAALDGAAEILAPISRWRALAEAVSRAPDDVGLQDEYAATQEAIERADGFALEPRVRRTLRGVGVPEPLWNSPVRTLSGGERTRLNLARALVALPDLLLLDEPTNHLDLSAIEWLETFLAGFRGAVVVASHDRRFLNIVARRILHLEDGVGRAYRGNYDAYRAARLQELAAQNHDVPRDTRRVLDVAMDLGFALPEARALLAALLFRGDRVFQRLHDLSIGETIRLRLLELLANETNLLVLDEPTNHLDLESRERLEEALDAYTGTLVIASHGRFLLDRLCTTTWAIEAGGVHVFDGNYTTSRAGRRMEARGRR